MITKSRYHELKDSLEKGANLPPVNLMQLQEYENNLTMDVQSQQSEQKYKPIRHSKK
jgi:hypothetical protein